MWKTRLMAAVWPAFLGAAILEMLVFAVVDPSEFHLPGLGAHPSNLAVYTTAFFLFWIGTFLSSMLTALLACKAPMTNGKPLG